MFTARLMKFGHGACFLSAAAVLAQCTRCALVFLLPSSLTVLHLLDPFCQRCLSSLRVNALRNRNTHSWPLQPPVNPSLHVRIRGLSAGCPCANLQCGWLCSGVLCGGPRLCSLIYTRFFLGSHETAASFWRDQRRLQLRGQARDPFGFGFLSPATVPHLA